MSESVTTEPSSKASWFSSHLRIAAAVVLALTLIRIVVLFNAFINLGPDEAQYWSWSRHLAFGYFSKPPMIAWLIAATTSVCGNGEACVRVSAPLLHAATAMAIFFLARTLYDERIALWSAIAYATLPIVWLSSGLITTDVPLVLFWSCGLLGMRKLIEAKTAGRAGDALRCAALTGLAIGFGLLSKYAMVYFVLCTAIYAVFSKAARRALVSRAGAVLVAVALLIYAPNLIWNASAGFATFEHTAADANWGAQLFNPKKLGEFLLAQIGVFGPVMTIMFLFGLMTLKKRSVGVHTESDRFLLCYALPILIIMLSQAFISRANANWAAPAYVAATILAVAWFLRGTEGATLFGRIKVNGRLFLNCSLAIHAVSGIVLYTLITVPGAIGVFHLENSFKRARGWETLAAKLENVTAQARYTAIVADNRLITAEITYYARNIALPVVIFDLDGRPANEFELKTPYTPSLGDPVLLVTARERSPVIDHFAVAEPLSPSPFRMEQGGVHYTDFQLIRLADFKPRTAG